MRGPPIPPPGPPCPPFGPLFGPPCVLRASANFCRGSSLSSVFSLQKPASVFLGATSALFLAGGAGGGGGSGCEGGRGPAGACARSPAAGIRQLQRIPTRAVARRWLSLIGSGLSEG